LEGSDLTATIYEKLVDEKHHYDNLSWLVGGGMVLVAGPLMAFASTIDHHSYWVQASMRLPVGAVVLFLLFAWYRIYERNRFWGEAANEALRDLERGNRIQGAGLAFMKAALTRRVELKNRDHEGSPVAEPHVETLAADSIHLSIRSIVVALGIVVLALCFLPSSHDLTSTSAALICEKSPGPLGE
jgi:hypothetical protein